ncbi:MAG: lactonase family protein [Terrimicrobiaceae bacterium]
MRTCQWAAVILYMVLMSSTLLAGNSRFFVGTYTTGTTSEGIYTGTLDTETGEIEGIRAVAEAVNPSFLARSPLGGFLYAVMEAKGGEVGAFRVDNDGGLAPLNVRPSGGAEPCHLMVTHSGRHVLVANYTGGSVACLAVAPDGSLGEMTDTREFEGSGPHPKRQQKSFAHAVVPDTQDRFVYVCDLGADKVWSFQFDSTNGTLAATEPGCGEVPPGGGPRHFVLSPDGRFAYANNELGLSVTAFRRDPQSGLLEAFQTLPTSQVSTGPADGVTTAEIVMHPTGRFLHVSSRGDNTLAGFSIADDGSLTFLESQPSVVDAPRGMALDPSGRWLVVAGQKDNRLATFAIDPDSGRLSPTGFTAEVPAPVCVVF